MMTFPKTMSVRPIWIIPTFLLCLGLLSCSAEEEAAGTPANPRGENPPAEQAIPPAPEVERSPDQTPPANTEQPQSEAPNEEPPASQPGETEEPEPEPKPVTLGKEVFVDLTPPIQEPEPPTRPRRRMDVEQLDKAMRTVSGGVGWTSETGTNLFEALAGSMGKPDYLNSVIEDLSPSALFQKFLDDASRDICNKLTAPELQSTQFGEVLFPHISPELSPLSNPEAVDANLRALLLKFHGRVLVENAAGLQHWKWLLNSSYAIYQDPYLAWRTVCVGLFVHPDFYSY